MLRQTINFCVSRRWIASLAVSALAWAPMSVLGQSIEVFTTAGEPVSNVPEGVAVIELDAPARLDAEISQGLSADLDAARISMRERMESPEWPSIMQRYGDLHTGVTRAWLLRVEKVPAVVVDGQYVVYGQHNVESAVQEIVSFIAGEAD